MQCHTIEVVLANSRVLVPSKPFPGDLASHLVDSADLETA